MKSAKPKLNVRLLRKIKRHILAKPSRFFMSWFVSRGKPGSRTSWNDQGYPKTAANLLGLPDGGCWSLFEAVSWPSQFKDDYYAATTPARRAKIAAARIEHLIKTGE